MSRWLKSVNNLLDKLDDQVDIADAAAFTQRMAARVGGAVQQTPSDDDDDDDDEISDSYDESESSFVDEEEEDDDGDDEREEEDEGQEDAEVSDMDKDEIVQLRNNPTDPTATPAASNYSYGEDVFFTPMDQIRREHISEIITPPRGGASPVPEQSVSSHTSNISAKPDQASIAATPPPNNASHMGAVQQRPNHKSSIKSPPNSGMSSSAISKSKTALKKLKQDNQRLQKLHATLEKSNAELKEELEHARAELSAQHEELQLAAERMEKDRVRNKEDREELLEEQEEELQQQKDDYENRLAEQKAYYENELREMRERLKEEEHKRLEEGGDWTKELEDALQRERDALKELVSVKSEKQQLESKVTTLESQRESLQTKVSSLKETLRNTTERERIAEEKLDHEMNQHKRQLVQKREREEQLERTVAELGAALSSAQQQVPPSSVLSTDDSAIMTYKAKYDTAMEELETAKSQLSHLTQQNQTLQRELQDMSRERAVDASLIQTRQREHDEQIGELNRQINHLEATLRSVSDDQKLTGLNAPNNASQDSVSQQHIERLSRELDQTKRQLAASTGQLVELKGLSDSSKAEVLVLKGRLQSAIERAEMAENTLASQSPSARACEMGDASYPNVRTIPRRRVRGGRGRFGHLPSRSMVSLLGLHISPGSVGEQISRTIDALDTWMLETGQILQHEPLARLGFAFYFTVVHLWCLGLVFFHTVQSEHSDLGLLTTHKRPVT